MFFASHNGYSQNAVGNSATPFNGWLYQNSSLTLGSDFQPQNILHLQNEDLPSTFIQFTNLLTNHSLPTQGFKIGIGANNDKDAYINQQEDANIHFLTYSSERAIITTSGKVGIGIQTPQNTLHIHSLNFVPLSSGGGGSLPSIGSLNINIGNNSSTQTKGTPIEGINSFQITNITTEALETDGLLLGNKGNTAFLKQQEDADLEFYTNNLKRATITKDGKIKIGQVSNQAQVNIKTYTNGINLLTQGSSVNYGLRIGIQATKNAILVNNKFAVKGDGKVGIGTINPQLDFDVKGKAYFQNFIGIGTIDASDPNTKLNIAGNYSKFKIGTQSEFIRIGRDGATNLIDGYATDSLLAINWYSHNKVIFGGKIGIGTNSPKYPLDVRGTAHFCKAIVKYNGWCDYVFENEYELMPLNKLKEYIQVEKHLPEIPTTKEIEQTDVDLGEMNKLLLKKVEELTLYIIKQQEQIDLQNAEIQNLKTK